MSQEQSAESSPASDDSPRRQALLPQQVPNARKAQVTGFGPEHDLEGVAPTSPHRSSTAPLQKRRRVTRACDECRKKKIKCDGRQPCTHCQVYTYECTYDQPSNRRRNPDPQHVEALETRLRRAKRLLNDHFGDVNLDDPSLDEQTARMSITRIRQTSAASTAGHESMLETMVETTGSLDIDDDGCWDFSGHSSGRSFLRHLRAQFGQVVGTSGASDRSYFNVLDSRISGSASSPNSLTREIPTRKDLPTRKCALAMCESAFDDVCAVLRPVHEPSFYAMLEKIYDRSKGDFDAEEKKFIPLFYGVMALGALFSRDEKSLLETSGFENAIDQGSKWFNISRGMIDVTDVRDLSSLQTLLFMTLFLQCSAKLSNCYAHIGICLSSALRMGLHRSIDHDFNPIEQETRKRIFWCIVKLDVYVGALLGLPRMLSSEDIDQEEPLEVDDGYITSTEIKVMPPGQLSLMAGFNAHSRIVDILSKVVKYIYPIKNQRTEKPHTYIVSHTRIREIEQDLQEWMEKLPTPFRPGEGGPRKFVRVQHILRMAYAHIEMFLYRPFLHYVSRDLALQNLDPRSYACSAACVNVSRNIIHLTDEMNKRKLLTGSYWFYMYTTFFAILSLLFFVLENPADSSCPDIFKDIYEGRNTLAQLSPKSLAADKCTKYLKDLLAQLSDRLKHAAEISSKLRVEQQQTVTVTRSNPSTTHTASTVLGAQTDHDRRSRLHHPSQPAGASNTGTGPTTGSNTHLPFPQPDTRAGMPNDGTEQWPVLPADHGVHDLGAMMFPSEDPFAYPNQPMIALENRQQFRPPVDLPQQYFAPTSNTINNQAYETSMAEYEMLQPSQTPETYPRSQSGTMMEQDAANMPPGGIQWQQQSRNQDFRPPQDYDNLFGEDWSAWGR